MTDSTVTLFLCGDVMTGRGIDQVLPHPGNPVLHEEYMRSATGYVDLAEQVNGPIAAPVDYSYIWGDALNELDRVAPDFRLINLETSITTSADYWPGKGVHYRMNPENIPCLTAAAIDCCSLANNHVLDWGYAGLIETLDTLERAKLRAAGAGRNLEQAQRPAVLGLEGGGRVLVFSLGSDTSGIPLSWAAARDRPGVNLLPDLSVATAIDIGNQVQEVKIPGDVVVASIHWGGNWGYEVPRSQVDFAHALIDHAGVDIVHGHSSHHVKAIEVHNGKLILYGCGDFLNDYEGISGFEAYRGDLGLMYFVSVDPATGRLARLRMAPTQVRRFRLGRASAADARWLERTLNSQGSRFGTGATLGADNTLELRW